jgi:hypothetical protein
MGFATFPSEQVGEDDLVASAESDGDGAAGGAVELVVICASCLSVILRVLFSVYQTSFLSVIFTSFILGFIQGVVSLLFGQFYSVCYFTSFGLGFGEFTLERIADRGPIVVMVEGASRTYDVKVP